MKVYKRSFDNNILFTPINKTIIYRDNEICDGLCEEPAPSSTINYRVEISKGLKISRYKYHHKDKTHVRHISDS